MGLICTGSDRITTYEEREDALERKTNQNRMVLGRTDLPRHKRPIGHLPRVEGT